MGILIFDAIVIENTGDLMPIDNAKFETSDDVTYLSFDVRSNFEREWFSKNEVSGFWARNQAVDLYYRRMSKNFVIISGKQIKIPIDMELRMS